MSDRAASLPSTTRMQQRPLIFLGLDAEECSIALMVCFVLSVVVCLFVTAFLGGFLLGLGAALIAFFVSIFLFGKYMQKIKHGKPNGYYQQTFKLKLQSIGIGNTFIVNSGYKDITCGDKE